MYVHKKITTLHYVTSTNKYDIFYTTIHHASCLPTTYTPYWLIRTLTKHGSPNYGLMTFTEKYLHGAKNYLFLKLRRRSTTFVFAKSADSKQKQLKNLSFHSFFSSLHSLSRSVFASTANQNPSPHASAHQASSKAILLRTHLTHSAKFGGPYHILLTRV